MNQKQTQIVAKKTTKHSLFGRTLRSFLVLSAFIIILLTIITFLVSTSLIKQRTLAQLSSVAAAKEDFLEEVLQNNRERTSLLSADLQKSEDPVTFLEERLLQMQSEGIALKGIALFDADGNLVASSGVSPETLPAKIQGRTTLFPHIGVQGWEALSVLTPVGDNGNILLAHYDIAEELSSLLEAPDLGVTGELLLAREENDHVVLLHYQGFPDKRPLVLGTIRDETRYGSPLARALQGAEGSGILKDYRGKEVFVSYRSLPILGWALAVQIDTNEALQGVHDFRNALLLIGLSLMGCAGIFAHFFARKLTGPLREMTRRVQNLGPGHWDFESSISTGDEVESLSTMVGDMASRLKKLYDNLEAEIAERTAELKKQYVKDRAILETIEHGVLSIDSSGHIAEANRAAAKMLGKTIQELVGKSVMEGFHVVEHGKDISGENHPILSCLRTDTTYRPLPNAHLNVICEDGRVLPIVLMVTPLIANGTNIGAVAVFQDVTEERKVDYIKSEFISLASHQLRTPISTLKWYIELFTGEDQKLFNDIQKDSLQEMTRAANRMSTLVEALLHTAQLEGQGIVAKNSEIDIAEFIQDVSEELRSLAKDAKISCLIEVPKEKIILKTDPLLLHVIFQNLFSNAVKYSKPGSQITIRLEKKDHRVLISVADAGIGIPVEEHTRIFQRLFRAKNALKTDTDGNGLGLYIAKMIIDILNGKLSFQSTEGKGTTFTVELPQ